MAGFSDIKEITSYSPYQYVHTGSAIATMDPQTGIFDGISVYSDDNADDVTLTVIAMDGTTTTGIQVTAGNTLFGPFTSYDITAATGAPNVTVIATERCAEWITKEWNYNGEGLNSPYSHASGIGYVEDGTGDTFHLPFTFDREEHDTGFIEVDIIQNTGGSAAVGKYTLADSEITSISKGGIVKFQAAGTCVITMEAKFKYKIKKT
jgi:hypothetical protein